MRILLVKPNTFRDTIQPPVGLGYLASAVRKRGHGVKVLDAMRWNMTDAEVIRSAVTWRPDVLGIQCFSTDVSRVRDLLIRVKTALPHVVTFAGGPHPTSDPPATIHALGCGMDFGFRGEGEDSIPAFLDRLAYIGAGSSLRASLSREPLPGLYWEKDGDVHRDGIARIQDVDALPMIAWDLLEPERYPMAPQAGFFRQFPVSPISVSRGCPFDCSFCAAHTISGSKMRYRSVENVMEEMHYLHRERGIREFHVIDDNFTWHRRYVLEFCEALRSTGLGATWTCPNGIRVDTLDREVLASMRQAGCYALAIGIESGSPRILKDIEKGTTLEMIREKVALIKEAGIDPVGYFILGFPEETGEEMEATVQLALELELRRAHFMLFRPLPGTRSLESIRVRGDLDRIRAGATSYAQVAYVLPELSPRSLKNIQRKAFLRFYFRLEKILDLAHDIRSWRHLVRLVGRAWRWLG